MYYSHTIEDNKIGLFTSFVKSLIEGRQEYKPVVNNVIEEAHALALGNKTLFNIDRDSYPIVVLLEENDPDFFKTVDSNKADEGVYQKVLNILTEQKSISYY
ncbi:hypothetical protein AAE02nite_32780 [Adhaeribacter aerolatus]|uniref:Uncharacterized protein n=2 Tax=Adhaeribacter aerolatus TaxID=670289 RepID=A0A512B0X9_9BACT|nr:hypothetical protein AAE02nite_32780 [Adhaeribacter aerolatus]